MFVFVEKVSAGKYVMVKIPQSPQRRWNEEGTRFEYDGEWSLRVPGRDEESQQAIFVVRYACRFERPLTEDEQAQVFRAINQTRTVAGVFQMVAVSSADTLSDEVSAAGGS